MNDALKLIVPFFSVPKNYDEVLRRLASLAFYEIYIIILILRANLHFNEVITALEAWGPMAQLVDVIPHHDILDPAGFGIAVALAGFSYIFQLHDRISDITGIRRRFDHNRILIPLAERVGVSMTKEKEESIASNRDKLMRAVFYKYASSASGNPLVDRHDIEHALGAWSWFWVFIEAVFYFAIGATAALWLGSSNLARLFAGVACGSLFAAGAQYLRLGRYALPQIDSIADDAAAAAHVRQQFDAL
jgi:hypothetical protein